MGLWAELPAQFGGDQTIPFADMADRMLFAEAIETVKCVDEGVLRSTAEANIGSIFGIGFPAWTGGVLQYINGFPGRRGLRGARPGARAAYGDRFTPPASLVALAESGGRYE